VRPGGWAFQYNNAHYPDLDDTAVVVMAMDRAQVADRMPIDRGVEWTVGLQSRNGGWGAFDADNDYDYLNNLPFADHGALLDPPTADVSARCVSMLAQLGERLDQPAHGRRDRLSAQGAGAGGSWFGRWGVNYIYGTWSVLCAQRGGPAGDDPPWCARGRLAQGDPEPGRRLGRGLRQLRARSQGPCSRPVHRLADRLGAAGPDGGGRGRSDAVERGVDWLVANQEADGLWGQEYYTGGGFRACSTCAITDIRSISRCGPARYRNQAFEHAAGGVRDVTRPDAGEL
jgi:squalene-hopene/tetraprenyl-beta-curcumene cyclase